jgi:hypothetical protein
MNDFRIFSKTSSHLLSKYLDMSLSPSTFGLDGITVRIDFEQSKTAKDTPNIDATPLPTDADQYPLVAKGRFKSDGSWFIYETNTQTNEYDLNYLEFVEAMERTS